MKTALVTGGNAGLGAMIADQLHALGFKVIPYDIKAGLDVRKPDTTVIPERLDVLVNCAGVNYINWLQNLNEDQWDEIMDTNAKGIYLMTQACLPALKKTEGVVLNIVSNAAHMPMRCSAAYNASKGAALILTKQLARELQLDGITVFSVSPNKLAGTEMSDSIDKQVCETRGWTMEQAQKYQLAGLLTGRETDPLSCAEFCAWLLAERHRYEALAGCDLPYGL